MWGGEKIAVYHYILIISLYNSEVTYAVGCAQIRATLCHGAGFGDLVFMFEFC